MSERGIVGSNKEEVMSDSTNAASTPHQFTVYEIRIEGHLGPQWSAWFGDVTITLQENGETILTCPVADQAQLYALLRKVRDLGAPLLSVTRLG